MAARQLHVVGHLARVVHLMTVVETRALAGRGTGAGHLLFSVGVGVLPGVDLPGGDLAAADHRGVVRAAPAFRSVLQVAALVRRFATISRGAAAAMASGGSDDLAGCLLLPHDAAARV